MKKLLTYFSFCAALLTASAAKAYDGAWQQISNTNVPTKGTQVFTPLHYSVYTMDDQYLKGVLFGLSTDPQQGKTISLPTPDGGMRDFIVWQDPMMPADLAARYPDIKTFTAHAVGNQMVTAKLDYTLFGFHAMIFDGQKTYMIDPYSRANDGIYMVHYKADEVRTANQRMRCDVKSSSDEQNPLQEESMMTQGTKLPKMAARTVNGYKLKTYRLALSADNFYCAAVGGTTIALALSAMTTSMNRINGVYEREFSVKMNFCSQEDNIIWTTASGGVNGTDPFNTIDNNGGACLGVNQTTCDNRVGSANYDIGHVFTTGGGGISSLGVVCTAGSKAQSCTGSPSPVGDGFDIDYVAHEMGHEFGSEHSFNNNNDGSCGGNAVAQYAYEPGSGSTIMAYAGICDPDDLQMHSDPYFAVTSMTQIISALNGSENTCAVATATSNLLTAVPAFTASYTIPYKTPFELIGPSAVDSAADTATTYCWEEYNRGHNGQGFGARLVNTFKDGPIFRSYNPVYNPTRVFPKVSMVLSGTLSNAGIEGAEGEKAADTARFLTFKMTVRDILNGNGCMVWPDDTIHLDVISTGATGGYQGFKVTSPAAGASWKSGTSKTVTWNVVGTNAAPVSCDSVDIYISADGGYTWPTHVGRYINNGSATITVPNMATTSQARVKVKGAGNVFFNVNAGNFTLAVDNVTLPESDVKVYPVPASGEVFVTISGAKSFNAKVINAVGQTIWSGTMSQKATLDVSKWAKGVYYLQLNEQDNNAQAVKRFIVD